MRYLPDDMLSAEQKKIKWEGLAETVKKTAAKNDEKYTKFVADGNMNAAQRMANRCIVRSLETKTMFLLHR